MKLVRVDIGYTRRVECSYVCSACGRDLSHIGPSPEFCPGCGRKLDVRGKPSVLENIDATMVSLVFAAIESGLLKTPLPIAKKHADDFSGSYWCAGEYKEEAR